MNVLFLCTGNSCRSILAEATFNHLAPADWRAMSAGSKPTGQVHPRSLALLASQGIATAGYHSKSWESLPVTPDIVVTVCASAAGETCPIWPGHPTTAHWGIADPAHVEPMEARREAFEVAYQALEKRIKAFLALDLESMSTKDVATAARLIHEAVGAAEQ